MKRLLLLLAAVVTLTLTAYAANRTVQGVVTSAEDGEPLMGATVVGVGTQIGASTDINGSFSLSLPDNVKTLKVSYVGMETREVPITDGIMKIEMAGSNVLDEVIAVAFGTAKKSAFTGSAAVVGAEELSKRITTNVADALVGTVPGLQMRGSSGAPGSTQGNMNIRGISSMFAETDPLVIVDGSPYPASLSNIPQGDIESITVLKDAASAALYGARGASGVIIITTKTGSAKEARVTLDAKWGANTRAVQRYDVIDNPGEFYEAYYDQVYNYYRNAGGYAPQQANISANNKMLNDLAYNVYKVPAGQTLIGMNGKLNPYATLGNTITRNGQEFYLTPDNWDDLSYHTGLRQEYNVSVNGGTDKATFYASLGYLNDEGFIRGSSYERLSARFKGDYTAKPWLKLGINAGYINSTTRQVPNREVDEDSSMNNNNLAYYTDYIAPIYPAFVRGMGADGKPYIMTDEYGHKAYDYGTPNSGYYLQRAFMGNGNPIGSNKYNKVESLGNQLNASFTADFTITSYLKANVTSSVTWGETEFSDFENPWYGSKAASNGQLDKSTTTSIRTNNIQSVTYFDQFGLHNVNVMAGHEWYKSETRYLYAMARGAFSPWIPEINAFASRPTSNSYKSAYNVEGYFARAQYDYDSKYFASLSYRRDASSRFATNHRWGNFWSFGAAWIINKDFLQDVNWINNLKVKASVGQQGNDNIGNWAYIDLFSLSQSSSTTMAPSFYQIGNPEITWETTTNWNFGLEFALFDNRLSGSIDGYYKRTNDLLFWLNIPESQGSRGYWGNIGDISNAGIEVVLNGTVVKTRDINWNINLNFAHNATNIISLPESKKIYGGFDNSENNINMWYEEGKPLYNLYLPKYAGVNEKGEALYYTDSDIDMSGTQKFPAKKMDGTTTDINLAPNYELGSSLPKLFGGFGTSIQLYGFDASVQFDFSLGGKVYDTQYAMYMTPAETTKSAGQTYHRDYKKSWSPENPDSNIPRWQFGDKYTASKSDRFLKSASYLNFQSFTVGYTLPRFWKEISNLRVFVMGENLCFWSARKGLDPRYAYTGNNGMSPYSPARNISGGVQVTF